MYCHHTETNTYKTELLRKYVIKYVYTNVFKLLCTPLFKWYSRKCGIPGDGSWKTDQWNKDDFVLNSLLILWTKMLRNRTNWQFTLQNHCIIKLFLFQVIEPKFWKKSVISRLDCTSHGLDSRLRDLYNRDPWPVISGSVEHNSRSRYLCLAIV